MKYNAKVVQAVWQTWHIPSPVLEHRFHPTRKWRFDFAWPEQKVAVEVQGGIWTQGRHTRGAALKKEWEKLNHAAVRGWRILYCEPREVTGQEFSRQLAAALAG